MRYQLMWILLSIIFDIRCVHYGGRVCMSSSRCIIQSASGTVTVMPVLWVSRAHQLKNHWENHNDNVFKIQFCTLLLFIIENSSVKYSTDCASEIGSVIILLSLNSCWCALHAFWVVTELRLCFFKAMAGISVCEIMDCVLWFPWSIDKHTIPETRPLLSSQHTKWWFWLCGEDSC